MALPILLRARRITKSDSLRLICRSMATVSRGVYDHDLGKTMPPGYKAKVGSLETFQLPERVTGSSSDKAMGQALVKAWKRDGIFQIAMSSSQSQVYRFAENASKRFFAKPHNEKAACVDSQSYAGYIASGEEIVSYFSLHLSAARLVFLNPTPSDHNAPAFAKVFLL